LIVATRSANGDPASTRWQGGGEQAGTDAAVPGWLE
jgi:hypothetical protein